MDVAAAGVDADFADDGDALVAHFLVFAVGEGHGWCDGYGVAGVDAEGVDVFDGADDDDVVGAVAHEFEFVFFPAEDGFFDEDVGFGGGCEAAAGDAFEVFGGEGEAGAEAAHGEGGSDDDGEAEFGDGFVDFVHGVADAGAGGFAADFCDNVFEFLAVFAAFDGFDVGADEFHVVVFEGAAAVELDGGVEGGLAAEGGEDRVDGVPLRDFFFKYAFDVFGFDGFHVGVVGEFGVGHDGGRVGVDEGDSHAFFFEYSAGLGAGVVEFAGLADDDGAGADDQDVVDVVTLGHELLLPSCCGVVCGGYRRFVRVSGFYGWP